jgi:hypothetical protein
VERKTLHDQRPSWDLVTVYYAIEGLTGFLKEEPKGWLDFDEEKGCLWIEGVNDAIRNHRYITQLDGVADELGILLNRLISQSP